MTVLDRDVAPSRDGADVLIGSGGNNVGITSRLVDTDTSKYIYKCFSKSAKRRKFSNRQ